MTQGSRNEALFIQKRRADEIDVLVHPQIAGKP